MHSGSKTGIVFAVAVYDLQGIAMPGGRRRRESGTELDQITAAGQRGVKSKSTSVRRDEDGGAALRRACGIRDIEMPVRTGCIPLSISGGQHGSALAVIFPLRHSGHVFRGCQLSHAAEIRR